MSRYNTLAIHEINKWVWHCLQRDLPLDFEMYTLPGPAQGLRPVIPTQQEATFNNLEGGPPFIVYNYTLTGGADSWWMVSENVVYTIYDSDEARLRRIHHYLNQLLRRLDFTAHECNQFLNLSVSSPFDIKYIGLTGGSGPSPFIAEGGRQGAILTFRVEYTIEIGGELDTDLDNPAGMRL